MIVSPGAALLRRQAAAPAAGYDMNIEIIENIIYKIIIKYYKIALL